MDMRPHIYSLGLPSDDILPAYPESLNDLSIAFGVLAAKIGQMTSPLAYHLDQAAAGMYIVLVCSQMFR